MDKKIKEVLEFYADEDNYEYKSYINMPTKRSQIDYDGGDKAQAILKEQSNDK